MNVYSKKLLLIFLLLLSKLCFAQTTGQRLTVIPPSPASSAIEKYNDYPVSIYTGLPEISVPIFEIISGDLKLPISISYHASGIKVGDKSYPVGLGWSLNAGGRVSRTVRGKPDESVISFPPNPLPDYYTYSAAGSQRAIISDLNNFDIEPDFFSFQLGLSFKASGKFLFDGAKKNLANGVLEEPMFLPKSNMKFSYVPKETWGGYSFGINSLNLLDEEGVSYSFGDSENSREYNTTGSTVSTWLVSKIVPTSRSEIDKISFVYANGATVFRTSYSGRSTVLDSCEQHRTFVMDKRDETNQLLYVLPEEDHFAYINNPAISEWMYNSSHVDHYYVKNLQTINFNGGKVIFDFNSTANLLNNISIFDSNNTLIKKANFYYSAFPYYADNIKLDSVILTGSDGQKIERYKFNYNEIVQGQNPLSQDYWGYYNGANNTSLLPVWNNVSTYSLDDGISGPSFPPSHKLITVGNSYREAEESAMKRFSLEKVTYPTGGFSIFEMEANRCLDEVTSDLKVVGGLRVKKIITRAEPSSPAMIRNFYYGPNHNGAGVAVDVPTYDDFVTERYIFFGDGIVYGSGWARERTFSSNPNSELSHIDGSAVYYTHVDEFLTSEGTDTLGKTSYVYEIPPKTLYGNYLDPNGAVSGTKNVKKIYGNNFPFLSEKRIYKKLGSGYEVVRADRHLYKSDSPFESNMNLQPKEIIYHPKYQFVLRRGPSFGDYSENHYLDMFPVFTMDEPSIINNLSYKIDQDVSITYVKTSTNQTDSLIQIKKYEYGSDKHFFATTTTSEASNGRLYKSRFKYPLDFGSLTGTDNRSTGINNLKGLNFVSSPIETYTEVWDNSLNLGVINAYLTTYHPDRPFVEKVYATEFDYPTLFSPSKSENGNFLMSNAYKEKQNLRYDFHGRIIQQDNYLGPKTSYIWSYGGMYPIVEVQNASYAAIEASLGGSQLLAHLYSIVPTKVTIDSVVAVIKSQLPQSYVTSSTYQPLVGMTSKTDAKGMTMYYEYDNFQRLKSVRDHNGDIIKSYCYSISGQTVDCNEFIGTTAPTASAPIAYWNGTEMNGATGLRSAGISQLRIKDGSGTVVQVISEAQLAAGAIIPVGTYTFEYVTYGVKWSPPQSPPNHGWAVISTFSDSDWDADHYVMNDSRTSDTYTVTNVAVSAAGITIYINRFMYIS